MITVYDQGSKICHARRLKEIDISVDGNLVRRYVFDYTSNYPHTKSLLESITEYGADGVSYLPSTIFSYSKKDVGWITQPQDSQWIPPVKISEENYARDTGVRIVDVDGDGLVDIIDNDVAIWINTGDGWQKNSLKSPVNFVGYSFCWDSGARLAEVNGDGLIDILLRSNYYFTSNNGTWINNGSGWDNIGIISPVDIFRCEDYRPKDTNTRLVDVNGDGLVDIINPSFAWINNKDEWQSDNGWKSPVSFDNEGDSSAGTSIVDVNGDGLVDLLFTAPQEPIIEAWINTGSGWEKDNTWIPPVRLGASIGIRMADVNGDGLVDIIQSSYINYASQGTIVRKFNAWLNTGNGWESNDSWSPPEYFAAYYTYPYKWMDTGARLVDVDGDGLIDIIANGETKAGDFKSANINRGSIPYLLTSINNSIGGSITINYTPSTRYNNNNLSHVYQCVSSVTTDNGMSGPHHTSSRYTYNYSGGLYDYQDKEFRGFAHVTITNPKGTKTHHNFHQTDALKGKEYKTETNDISGNPYTKTENSWSYTESNGIYTIKLDKTDDYTYDGNPNNPKITGIEYEYDDYGNPTEISSLGNLDISGDEKYIYMEYNYNTNAWIVDKPRHTTLYDADYVRISKSEYAYDNLPPEWPPTKGDLTGEFLWLDTSDSYIVNWYWYDDYVGGYGNLIETWDGRGHKTKYRYGITDPTHTFPEQVINDKGHTHNYRYDPGTGSLLNVTDPNGYTTRCVYDVFGRITHEYKPDDELWATSMYGYYRDGHAPEGVRVLQRTGEAIFVLDRIDTYTFIDGLGGVIQTRTDAEDVSKQVVQNTFYNEIGKIQNQSVPYFSTYTTNYTIPQSARAIEFEYDTIGRVTTQTNTDGTTKTIEYDHWKTTATDENWHDKIYHNDAYGRITRVDEKNKGDTYTTAYEYNARDELIEITDDQNNLFEFKYDSLGRKTMLIDPDMGTWTYIYDKTGNLMNQTDARGITTEFEYDSLNRITKTSYPNDPDITYTYDTETIGTLSTIESSLIAVHYYYDERLRNTREEFFADGRSWTKEWNYDSADRIINQTNPDNELITYTYNKQNRLESISGVVNNFNYNALGKITGKEYSNGIPTSLIYKTDDFRLEYILTFKLNPVEFIQDTRYSYDNAGNIILIHDAVDGFFQTFGYDHLDRLTNATESGGFDIIYGYNSIGNIMSVNENGKITSYVYGTDAGPHAMTRIIDMTFASCVGSIPPTSGDWIINVLTTCVSSQIALSAGSDLIINEDLTIESSDLTLDGDIVLNGDLVFGDSGSGSTVFFGSPGQILEYDINGNLVSGFGKTFEYNDANRLKRVMEGQATIAEYFYNPTGRRFKKIAGGVTTYYIGKDYETKISGGNVENTVYYYGNGELLARKDHNGSRYFYHNDHLGGTNVVTNESGDVVERTRYYPFGKILEGGTSRNLYTGQEFDKETGIYYYGARYYNPEIRRFVQPDPIIPDYYDPQSLNRYSYVENNPVKYVDPTGNFIAIPVVVLGYAAI